MISLKTDKQLNTEAIQLRQIWGLNSNAAIDIIPVVLSKLPNLTLLYNRLKKHIFNSCLKF
ncbi:hypothetical protein [uncultured Methanobrevibacter sp.]|uniref:hypothetical protein n=1 Tax=uncultured Methanobrevibacter sp. TaxID=253161 RepID=UPI0025D064CA|nr:hypothetical protein [uncultured Methanobrevibacter sp.]